MMSMFRLVRFSLGLLGLCLALSGIEPGAAQEARPAPAARPSIPSACTEVPREDSLPALCAPPSVEEDQARHTAIVALEVPLGTPLRIALDQRVRISHPGAAIHGRVVEPVYAFDQIVIPAGSAVTGHVTRVEPVSAPRRTFSYAQGDFSPPHKYEVAFETLTLPDGKRLAIPSVASPASAEMVHLFSRPEKGEERKKNAAARAVEGAKNDAQDKVHGAIDELRSPGRMHRLKQWLIARLPYRRQYLEPGTRFNASLSEALAFGVAPRTEEQLALLGSALPPDGLMHARLLLEVSSASAMRGNPVVATLTEPLCSSDHRVILPAETRLIGAVLQARPARKLHRNGELRVIFEHVEMPDGALRAVQGSLEGVEVGRAARLRLDEEGGAHATERKTRYLSTGLAIAVAALASHPDTEHGTTDPGGDPAIRTGAGGAGFGLAGSLISLAAKSTPVSIAFGVYGASSSIYANFLSRGRDVVLPRDTALEIGFGATHPAPVGAPSHP